MKKTFWTLILVLSTRLTVSCSALSLARLFEPLEWQGQWDVIDTVVLDSFPLGSDYALTYERESDMSSEIVTYLALWNEGERLGVLPFQPASEKYIDGFISSNFLYMTYVQEVGEVSFAKVNPVNLTPDFAVDILPSGTLSTDSVCFATDQGFGVVLGNTSEQTWVFIDSVGTITDTQITYFALTSYDFFQLPQKTYGPSILKVDAITYINFDGNLLSFDGEECTHIPSPRVLGFPETSQVLSYYYTNDRGDSTHETFTLYRTSDDEIETVINIDKKYLKKIEFGKSLFFQDDRVYVMGLRLAGYVLFPCMLIFDYPNNQTYWSEFHDSDRQVFEPFYLIGNEFYCFSDYMQGTDYLYWHASIPLQNA